MLSDEETILLIRKSKTGDNLAKEKLLVNNERLINSIVKRFCGRGVEYDDLFQLASIGFLKAIEHFDESFSVRFSTYAVPMIMGEIKRFLRDDGCIKVSRIIKSLSYKINAYLESEKQKGKAPPSVDQLAEIFGAQKEDVILAIGASKQVVSIYESVNDDGNKPIEVIDLIGGGDDEEKILDRVMIKNLLDGLDERERRIIVLRYFGDRTQSEIAKMLGVSQVQVSRLENKIVEKLKRKIV